MLSEFAQARWSTAAATYDGALAEGLKPAPDAILLRARILLKLDEKKAVPFLLAHRFEHAPLRERATRSMYLGMAYARMRDFAEADRHFSEAASHAGDARFRSELAYQRARRHLLHGDTLGAWHWHEAASADRSLAGRIRSEQLRSFILAQEERYVDQARSVVAVLDAIGNKRDDFLEEWCTCVHTLAVLARELPLFDFAERAQRELDAGEAWPDDFRTSWFQALKAVGWCKALQGDSLNAFRYLRRAQSVAPSVVWTAMVHLDRAHFARTIREEQWADNEVAAAEEIAASIDWEATGGEERVALLLLAESVSPIDPARGTFYVARYSNLGAVRSNLHHFAFDHRMEALAAYATGIVKRANGNATAAEESFRTAWTIFDRIGYAWRAGRAALRLFETTGKSRWAHLAEDKFEPYAKSWLADEWRRSMEQPDRDESPRLTPMQERIFRLICAGHSTDAIARELRRSHHTVRNHLKLVFKAFGVNSRSALVAHAARRGLID